MIEVFIDQKKVDFGDERMVFFKGRTDAFFGEMMFRFGFEQIEVLNVIGFNVFVGCENGVGCFDVFKLFQLGSV